MKSCDDKFILLIYNDAVNIENIYEVTFVFLQTIMEFSYYTNHVKRCCFNEVELYVEDYRKPNFSFIIRLKNFPLSKD